MISDTVVIRLRSVRPDDLHGILVTDHGGAMFTDDGGRSAYAGEWNSPMDPYAANEYCMTGLNTVYVVGQSGRLMKSADKGKTWTAATGFTSSDPLKSIHFPSSRVGFACGDRGRLIRTADAGATWQELAPPAESDWTKVRFTDERTGFLCNSSGEDPQLWRTENGGDTWSRIRLEGLQHYGSSDPVIALQFFSPREGLLATRRAIARTTDGGKSWRLAAVPAETSLHVLFR